MTRRSYAGNTQPTTLASPITNIDTSLTVVSGTNYPDGSGGPAVLTLDAGLAAEEKVLYTSRTGNVFSGLTRGFDGTAAGAHAAGANVRHSLSAVDINEANAHINATSAAHAASAISYAGSVNLSSTDVESALDELDAEKAIANNPQVLMPFYVASSGGTGWSNNFPASANLAVYMKFRTQAAITVSSIRYAVNTAAGNVDIGIYADSAGLPAGRLVSTGSIACPSAGLVTQAITPTALAANTSYWLAFAASSTSLSIYSAAPSNTPTLLFPDAWKTQVTALPLPASATPVAMPSGTVLPIMYIAVP